MCHPRMDLCYCGCTIKTGTLVILWPSLIICIFGTFYDVGAFGIPSGLGEQREAPSLSYWMNGILAFGGIYGPIIMTIFVVIAIRGVYQGHHSYLVPYLIWQWINFILYVVLYGLGLQLFYRQDIAILIAFSTTNLVQSSHRRDIDILIAFVLRYYFWLVTYRHYRDLKKPQTAPSAV